MGKIRIYTNESVDVAIAEGLKRRGLDASSSRDTGNLGSSDAEQLIYAGKEKAAIFTHDIDFLRIAARLPIPGKSSSRSGGFRPPVPGISVQAFRWKPSGLIGA